LHNKLKNGLKKIARRVRLVYDRLYEAYYAFKPPPP
jgi:hypothetical protein